MDAIDSHCPIVQVNGGGELSPKNSATHGQGSPLRSSLALKLKSTSPRLQCPMCNYTSSSPNELEEHVNRYDIHCWFSLEFVLLLLFFVFFDKIVYCHITQN